MGGVGEYVGWMGAECLSNPSTPSSRNLTGEITTAAEPSTSLGFSIRDTSGQNKESFIRRGSEWLCVLQYVRVFQVTNSQDSNSQKLLS